MPFEPPETPRSIAALRQVMAQLRAPEGGCPWDLEQDHRSIAPYCLEEAYEVVDAIENGTDEELREELGDLLLQVVFHSQMALERGAFDFDDVCEAIVTKMVRRHPHVFADADGRDATAQTLAWEEMKAQERAEKGDTSPKSLLDDVPVALPALTRAEKLAKRAARAGYEWPDFASIIAKLREEIDEVEQAHASGDKAHTAEEIGDVLLTATSMTRYLGLDGETILRAAGKKFERRFRAMEQQVAESGKAFEAHTIAELEDYWQNAKREEH